MDTAPANSSPADQPFLGDDRDHLLFRIRPRQRTNVCAQGWYSRPNLDVGPHNIKCDSYNINCGISINFNV
jgi:hypothetical protein